MRISNSTVLPAKLQVSPGDGDQAGVGALIAKATFRFDNAGHVEAETQAPIPLLDKDVETPLGALPADLLGRNTDRFEVMLLGQAHAPKQLPTTELRVGLGVGHERREIAVFGDRAWESGEDGTRRIGHAQPFSVMPLVYERAFGGSVPAQTDADSVLDLFDPINKRGLGFDAEMWASSVGVMLRAPQGYPRLGDYRRRLPNLEDPRALIQDWSDAPEPVGWAPVYLDTAVGQLPLIRRESQRLERDRARGEDDPQRRHDELLRTPDPDVDPDSSLNRAHPDWVIDTPPEKALIRLENLLSDAPLLEFPLPALRVIADYVIYGREGSRELRPQALVLLPEQRSFYLVYRLIFTFENGPASERSFRLRTEEGWFQPERE
ncbi:MAG TPA: DUF2169 domain-containing protein [Polyangiaceae bacterium]|nr:DUF2169 domain-containing protein [Polyangiaceae bacterium]